MNEIQNYYNNLLSISGTILNYSSLLPIIMAIWKWKHLNRPMKLVFWYLVVLLIMEIVERLFYWGATKYYEILKPFLIKYEISDTNFLSITHSLPDFVFLGWVFSYVFSANLAKRVKVISIILFVATIFIYFYIDGYNKFGVVNPILDRLYLIIIPVIYFYNLSKSPPILSLWKNPFFLFGFGLFVQNIFSLYVGFYGNKLNETDFPTYVKIYLVKNAFSLVSQVFFIMAFFHARFAKFLVNKF